MRNRYLLFTALILLSGAFGCGHRKYDVTMSSLLDEMTDLSRLTTLGGPDYRTIQFSSYDRRSKTPADSLWFANEDGFGGEPVPGFEKTLKEPDSTGTGEYLICDIQGPGVIQRLWTAAISGRIRLYLDDLKSPVYDGRASDFFWKPLAVLAGITDSATYSETFRQFDATYLPVPFSRNCRIEWIGDIKDPHFYHVGMRLYDQDVKVEAFSRSGFIECTEKLNVINKVMLQPESLNPPSGSAMTRYDYEIETGAKTELFNLQRQGAIDYLNVRLIGLNTENSLRQCMLNIYFDNADIPQVRSPLGDFFGAAPGLNPFQSLAFTVSPDSSMVCRFLMPFQSSVRIEAENRSADKITMELALNIRDYAWKDGESMHFMARWKMAHDLTAYNTDGRIYDMNYLSAKGSGRLVGAATYLYNPSGATVSWGNWWGEGDEKIFVDGEAFPSFFGTGSEDYYNYSWSSARIFSYPYCGQPRNDGPGNRGYVSNFRWHIADDIPFKKELDFNMELRHHGVIPGFSYGSIVYFYAMPGLACDSLRKGSQISEIRYQDWSPLAYLGSAGYKFIQAEKVAAENKAAEVVKGNLWAGEYILSWTPLVPAERLVFNLQSDKHLSKTRIGLTLAHCPGGGSISFTLNGKAVKFGGRDIIDMGQTGRTILDNHFSEPVELMKGKNQLVAFMPGADGHLKALFDFIWLREK